MMKNEWMKESTMENKNMGSGRKPNRRAMKESRMKKKNTRSGRKANRRAKKKGQKPTRSAPLGAMP